MEQGSAAYAAAESAFGGLAYARLRFQGAHLSGRKGVVPRKLCVVGEVVWSRRCVWRDRALRPVVLERMVPGLATTRPAGRCRYVLAMGNSVAPIVCLVVAHHKDSQCAAVMHRNGAECARDGAKRKTPRRCCLPHSDGAGSASDDAVEVDAQAVVQAPVGVVVE